MKGSPPKKIAINHDEYHTEHIGRTADGRQFILTMPFEPATGGKAGREYLALYLFDSDGQLIESKIEDSGPRSNPDTYARWKEVYDSWLKELGAVTFERIEVAPFSIERFGTTFGLVIRVPENEEDVWAVEMQPGNYLAFLEPWDSGNYHT